MANDEIEIKTYEIGDAPDEVLSKEFDDGSQMDDSEAFLESVTPGDHSTATFDANALSSWRPAKSLKKLQKQVNDAFPGRNKASDGMIGDTAHCPGPSDHCPNIDDGGVGVVTAYDITHDPDSGCDMHSVTRSIVNDQDSRIKYIIYNREICSSYPHSGKPPWTWRPYSGSNPHTRHAHFSVKSSKSDYDDTRSWAIGAALTS